MPIFIFLPLFFYLAIVVFSLDRQAVLREFWESDCECVGIFTSRNHQCFGICYFDGETWRRYEECPDGILHAIYSGEYCSGNKTGQCQRSEICYPNCGSNNSEKWNLTKFVPETCPIENDYEDILHVPSFFCNGFQPTDPMACSGIHRGKCLGPEYCHCEWPFYGENCEFVKADLSCPNSCTNRGFCTSKTNSMGMGYCQCNPGWKGVDCSEEVECNGKTNSADQSVCNYEGFCARENVCVCNEGWVATSEGSCMNFYSRWDGIRAWGCTGLSTGVLWTWRQNNEMCVGSDDLSGSYKLFNIESRIYFLWTETLHCTIDNEREWDLVSWEIDKCYHRVSDAFPMSDEGEVAVRADTLAWLRKSGVLDGLSYAQYTPKTKDLSPSNIGQIVGLGFSNTDAQCSNLRQIVRYVDGLCARGDGDSPFLTRTCRDDSRVIFYDDASQCYDFSPATAIHYNTGVCYPFENHFVLFDCPFGHINNCNGVTETAPNECNGLGTCIDNYCFCDPIPNAPDAEISGLNCDDFERACEDGCAGGDGSTSECIGPNVCHCPTWDGLYSTWNGSCSADPAERGVQDGGGFVRVVYSESNCTTGFEYSVEFYVYEIPVSFEERVSRFYFSPVKNSYLRADCAVDDPLCMFVTDVVHEHEEEFGACSPASNSMILHNVSYTDFQDLCQVLFPAGVVEMKFVDDDIEVSRGVCYPSNQCVVPNLGMPFQFTCNTGGRAQIGDLARVITFSRQQQGEDGCGKMEALWSVDEGVVYDPLFFQFADSRWDSRMLGCEAGSIQDDEIEMCYGIPYNDSHSCTSHGKCYTFPYQNDCECEKEYKRADCGSWYCDEVERHRTETVCNSHGICTAHNTCECFDMTPFNQKSYSGHSCTEFYCYGLLNSAGDVCNGHGICEFEPLLSSPNRCVCVGGYSGADCGCAPTHCQNGGVCEDLAPNFNCSCTDGFHGDVCQCHDSKCSHGGRCVGSDVICTCLDWWDSVDDCVSCLLPEHFNQSICDNRTCDLQWGGSNCDECAPGFYGMDCSCIVNCSNLLHHGKEEEEEFLCISGKCTCEELWQGILCDECILDGSKFDLTLCNYSCATGVYGPDCSCLHDCMNIPHAIACVNGSCSCQSNWEGDTCSTCVFSSDFHQDVCDGATCAVGRFGTDCSCSVNCSSLAHSINGICNSSKCLCEENFSGEACQICAFEEAYHQDVCDGVTCAAGRFGDDCSCFNDCEDLQSGHGIECVDGVCLCEVNWQGPLCDHCVLTSQFDQFLCNGTCAIGHFGSTCACSFDCPNLPHGISCNDSLGGGVCECEDSWSGLQCELCEYPSEYDQVKCNGSCAPGFYGDEDCSCTLDCVDLPSGRGVECVSASCKCEDNFEGVLCDVCVPGKFGADCSCSVDCLDLPSGHGSGCENGSCVCEPNYFEGELCDICVFPANFDQFVCDGVACRDGMFGSDCSCVSDCPNLPSGHGISCQNGSCSCDPNFEGNLCDECVFSQPPDFFDQVVCNGSCNSGRFGEDCSCSLDCLALPSGNGESCENATCICSSGFFGGDCSCTVNCQDLPSGHGVSCNNGSCLCSPGYFGSDCSCVYDCPNLSSGRGIECVNGSCSCEENFEGILCDTCSTGKYGDDCSCSTDCSIVEHSTKECVDGRCECLLLWGPESNCSVCYADLQYDQLICDGHTCSNVSFGSDCSCSIDCWNEDEVEHSNECFEGDCLCEDFWEPPNLCTSCTLSSQIDHFDTESCDGSCLLNWSPFGNCSECIGFSSEYDQELCNGTCATDRFGSDCSCTVDCTVVKNSADGLCIEGECACDTNFEWTGFDCSGCKLSSELFDQTFCNGTCASNRFGADCSCRIDCSVLENSRGSCTDGECDCEGNWAGSNCSDCVLSSEFFDQSLCNYSCASDRYGADCSCIVDCSLLQNALGTCTNGACTCLNRFEWNGVDCSQCDSSHFGSDCSCLVNCSDLLHSTSVCSNGVGVCECKSMWSGERCDVCDYSREFNQVICDGSSCAVGYYGSNCSCTLDCENLPSGNGVKCVDGGVCECEDNWSGVLCNECDFPQRFDQNLCNGIDCSSGWFGSDCSCLENCESLLHGIECMEGIGRECRCEENWSGAKCNECDFPYQFHQLICDGVACSAGFYGVNCSCIHDCPNLPHGDACVSGSCTCDPFWSGEICDVCDYPPQYDPVACDGVTCAMNRFGNECSCTIDCSSLPHGIQCINGTGICECAENWRGSYCDICDFPSQFSQSVCDGVTCADNRFGRDCLCTVDCENLVHGVDCIEGTGKCECEEHWQGYRCDSCDFPLEFDQVVCNGVQCATNRYGGDCSCTLDCVNLLHGIDCMVGTGTCSCEENWHGPHCGFCSFPSKYDQSVCDGQTCATGHYGMDCTCENDCSTISHSSGDCISGECVCLQNWDGLLCEYCLFPEEFFDQEECDGVKCKTGRYGSDCSCDIDCSSLDHSPGSCTDGFCDCDPNWSGSNCNVCEFPLEFDQVQCDGTTCTGGRYGLDCSCNVDCENLEHGIECFYGYGTCLCDATFTGVFCDVCRFPPEFDQIVCDGKTCAVAHFGADCSCEIDCFNLPHGVDECVNGKCLCDGNWEGDKCDECGITPEYCNMRGIANEHCTLCECENNWSVESDCSVCPMTPKNDCNGRGEPDVDCLSCDCFLNKWEGPLCNTCRMTEADCNFNGMPDKHCHACECDNQWKGEFCDECLMDRKYCSGNGEPDEYCLYCECEDLWDGKFCYECNEIVNPKRGTCEFGVCAENWIGNKCDECEVGYSMITITEDENNENIRRICEPNKDHRAAKEGATRGFATTFAVMFAVYFIVVAVILGIIFVYCYLRMQRKNKEALEKKLRDVELQQQPPPVIVESITPGGEEEEEEKIIEAVASVLSSTTNEEQVDGNAEVEQVMHAETKNEQAKLKMEAFLLLRGKNSSGGVCVVEKKVEITVTDTSVSFGELESIKFADIDNLSKNKDEYEIVSEHRKVVFRILGKENQRIFLEVFTKRMNELSESSESDYSSEETESVSEESESESDSGEEESSYTDEE